MRALAAACALALLLALGVVLVSPAAHAASGTVTFLQRNYAVRIEANGDVQVVEHWQVQFSGGPFHTAHLDLHTRHTSGIDFGTVSGATPGSQHTAPTADAAGNPMTELDWDYAPAQDTTRSFDIPYTIHGALQVGTAQAWLDWTFLDPGTSESSLAVNSSAVTEILPADAPPNTLSVQATNPEATPTTSTPDARTATASVQSIVASDGFEVEVAFPRTLLAVSVRRPAWQTSDTPPQLQQPQPGSGGGPYGNPGSNGGPPASVFPGVSNLCGFGFIPLIIFGLIIFSLIRSFFGVGPRGGYLGRRMYGPWGGWGGPWGPWYGGGPWNHPGGPWGGGGFGGGGMGGGGGFGGGAGGGGGGGGAGFG